MRKKEVKHFSFKRFLILGAITFSLPAFTAVPVAASESANTVTIDDIEQKRKVLEQAQKEYDMALAGQHAAEDLVENARRARDDAQEQYDICIEKYKKGFAGFLQWVIDTEEDPLKVEDARSTLALLQESGETDEISPLSPRNITRMFFTAQWLDEYADFLEQYEDRGLTATTSHDLMNWTQDTDRFSPDELYEDYYSPHLELRQLGTFAEDKDGIPVLEHSETEYNRSTGLSMRIDDDEWLLRGHATLAYIQRIDDTGSVIVGLSTFVNPVTGENLSLDYVNYGDGREPYTLREYARALRDYYALVDPLTSRAALDGFNDDFTNAKKELKGAEELVSSKFSRLKEAQKDYEEAVAQYNSNTTLTEQKAVGTEKALLYARTEKASVSLDNTADEMPVYSGEILTETSATDAYNTSLQETTSDTVDKKVNETSPVSLSSVAENTEIQPEGSGYVQPVSSETTFTYGDILSEKDNSKNTAEEQNSILLRVLSYIFNGGAIAIIIPAGFFRRKEVYET